MKRTINRSFNLTKNKDYSILDQLKRGTNMDKKDLLLFNLDYIKQIPKTKDSKEKYRFYLVRQRRIGEKEFKQLEFEYDYHEIL